MSPDTAQQTEPTNQLPKRPYWRPPMWLVLRCVWTAIPNLWTCGAFWIAALAWPVYVIFKYDPPPRPSDRPKPNAAVSVVGVTAVIGIWIGAAMNAVVTLVNGGFMPVSGWASEHVGNGGSLWVRSVEAHRLRWLGDNYAGFSLGDFVLLTGALIALVCFALTKTPKKQKYQDEFKRSWNIDTGRVLAGFMAFVSAPHFWTGGWVGVLFSIVVWTACIFMERFERRMFNDRLRWERERREFWIRYELTSLD